MKGVVKLFDSQRGFGFLEHPDFPDGVFCHAKAVHLPPGEYLRQGQEVTFNIGRDRQGRPRAENVQPIGQETPNPGARPYAQLAGGRRVYDTRVMQAEPAAIERDRQRRRDGRGRRDRREAAERLWTHGGADEV